MARVKRKLEDNGGDKRRQNSITNSKKMDAESERIERRILMQVETRDL